MIERVFNVLFLCADNSARSIIAESILNHAGKGRFRAFSAGSHPRGEIDPFVMELLEQEGLPTGGLRSKSWDEFTNPGAPAMDFVITLCDKTAGEVCPVWPGHPATAHWSIEDPAAVGGDDQARRRAVEGVLQLLNSRMVLFVSLRFAELDVLSLQREVADIGRLPEQGD
ncbi:arsenate reductase ArsC [Aromatoleum bremense]|uniref:Arsenate reductase ArsC n=1 Tax=Aromatoleum bremense TaxID=76115 RepID=A0ABX1NZJ8_9RHOO|nr:arsenate reductase ArsC [Aromatoleum bremense]NMG16832.1 arsenate reductase ArsC [Aromatoleum bremense]QTQ30391.1 Phosphotyrosine phosphatase I [Aromatoleum bremense]